MGREKIDFATPEQIVRAFENMSAPDLLRLEQFARFRVRLMPWLEWQDLLNEAISRALGGDRRWPLEIPFIQFLRECVRSLAHEEMRQHVERPITTASEMSQDEGYDPFISGVDGRAGPERDIAARQGLEVLRAAFAGDPAVSAVIAGLMQGDGPDEICQNSGLTKTEYQSAQKRIRRWAISQERFDLPESSS